MLFKEKLTVSSWNSSYDINLSQKSDSISPLVRPRFTARLLHVIPTSQSHHHTHSTDSTISSNHDNTISATLQILFGITGIFSVIVGVFGLHHRDSLVFVLYRRLRTRPTRCMWIKFINLLWSYVQVLTVMIAHSPEDGFASSDTNFDDQSTLARTWTDQSQLLFNTSPAASSPSEPTSDNSNSHLSSCCTVVGTKLAELPGCQL